jgi:hypothetical protein
VSLTGHRSHCGHVKLHSGLVRLKRPYQLVGISDIPKAKLRAWDLDVCQVRISQREEFLRQQRFPV